MNVLETYTNKFSGMKKRIFCMICRSRGFILYMFALTGHNQLQQESGEAWTKMSPPQMLWKRNRCSIILMLENDVTWGVFSRVSACERSPKFVLQVKGILVSARTRSAEHTSDILPMQYCRIKYCYSWQSLQIYACSLDLP